MLALTYQMNCWYGNAENKREMEKPRVKVTDFHFFLFSVGLSGRVETSLQTCIGIGSLKNAP
jgi:hypothetical protein